MKRRSAALDDVFNELQLVLDDDGGRLARGVRRIITWGYRLHKAFLLVIGWFPWCHSEQYRFPGPGHEPFNLSDEELESAWRHR